MRSRWAQLGWRRLLGNRGREAEGPMGFRGGSDSGGSAGLDGPAGRRRWGSGGRVSCGQAGPDRLADAAVGERGRCWLAWADGN